MTEPKFPQLEEKDYRGILALGFTATFAAISALSLYLTGTEGLSLVAAIFGPMEGLIVGFYFGKESK